MQSQTHERSYVEKSECSFSPRKSTLSYQGVVLIGVLAMLPCATIPCDPVGRPRRAQRNLSCYLAASPVATKGAT